MCLYELVSNRNLTVQHALIQNRWSQDFNSQLTEEVEEQLQTLHQEIINREDDGVREDVTLWRWNGQGTFTVSSFYNKMEQEPLIRNKISLIWKLKAPTRVAVFTWLMLQNKILTVDNLVRRGWNYQIDVPYARKQKSLYCICTHTAHIPEG